MMNDAKAFWEAIKGKARTLIREESQNCLRCERYDVTSAPADGLIGVRQPFGTQEIMIPYSSEVSSAQPGDTVLVLWWGNSLSTAKAWYFGSGPV